MVELLGIFGDDNMVCDTARVSLGKKACQYTDKQNESLIEYLAKHKHWSPFSHPQLQFRVSCPIYVERQLFKHRVGISINSISSRYVDFSDTYTKIDKWRKQSQSIKQGSEGYIESQKFADNVQEVIISMCKEAYKQLVEIGVCKEQARTVLPLCLNTEFIWTGSLYAFVNMCKQRLDSSSQEETRLVVQDMLSKVKEKGCFTISLKSFGL